MATIVTTKKQCDRCGTIADKFEKCFPSYIVTASVEVDHFAGSRLIEWVDMCEDCHREVGLDVKEIQMRATAARAKRGASS